MGRRREAISDRLINRRGSGRGSCVRVLGRGFAGFGRGWWGNGNFASPSFLHPPILGVFACMHPTQLASPSLLLEGSQGSIDHLSSIYVFSPFPIRLT